MPVYSVVRESQVQGAGWLGGLVFVGILVVKYLVKFLAKVPFWHVRQVRTFNLKDGLFWEDAIIVSVFSMVGHWVYLKSHGGVDDAFTMKAAAVALAGILFSVLVGCLAYTRRGKLKGRPAVVAVDLLALAIVVFALSTGAVFNA